MTTHSGIRGAVSAREAAAHGEHVGRAPRRGLRGLGASVFVALALTGAGSGCYRHLAVTAGTVPEAMPRSAQWHHHVLWGIVNLSEPEVLNAICPQGVSQVYTRVTLLNWLLSAITGGIYSPTRVDVWCAQGGSASAASPIGPVSLVLRPTAENVARWRRAYPDLEARLRELGATAQAKPTD